jgi:hypothetical protein
VPGVTTVLRVLDKGEGLREWYASQGALWARDHHDEIRTWSDDAFVKEAKKAPALRRDAKATRGKTLHAYLEVLQTGAEVEPEPELRAAAEQVADFLDKHDVHPIAAELPVYHEGLRYAGTLDLIADLQVMGEWQRWLLDLKTGYVGREAALQLAAYRHATHASWNGRDLKLEDAGITHTGVIRLRDNAWELLPVVTNDQVFSAFRHLLAVHQGFLKARDDELLLPPLAKP